MSNPKVSIIHFTGAGTNDEQYYAARLLAYTKNTRLNMTPEGFDKFMKMPVEKLTEELLYMSNSIPSSWEFVGVIFAINDISRACAQQITRTRFATFAMQSQRVTNMSQVTWHNPESVKNKELYDAEMHRSIESYSHLIECGESLEDARGVLPINVHCNLVAMYNLRTLVDLLRARESLRVQGEYRDVCRQMKAEVFRIWPWVEPFFEPPNKKAIDLIESVAAELTGEQRMALAKAADLIKKS